MGRLLKTIPNWKAQMAQDPQVTDQVCSKLQAFVCVQGPGTNTPW